jgi:hypothetical protein
MLSFLWWWRRAASGPSRARRGLEVECLEDRMVCAGQALTGVIWRETVLGTFTAASVKDSAGAGSTAFTFQVVLASGTSVRVVSLNPDRPAHDLAVVNTGAGWAVATVDAYLGPAHSSASRFAYTVSLYSLADDGSVRRSTAFSPPFRPLRLAAVDLTGDGLDDLIVSGSLPGSVSVAVQTALGEFNSPFTLPVGLTSDLAVFPVKDGREDIGVSNPDNGDAATVFNEEALSFAQSPSEPAGLDLSGRAGQLSVQALRALTSPAAPGQEQDSVFVLGWALSGPEVPSCPLPTSGPPRTSEAAPTALADAPLVPVVTLPAPILSGAEEMSGRKLEPPVAEAEVGPDAKGAPALGPYRDEAQRRLKRPPSREAAPPDGPVSRLGAEDGTNEPTNWLLAVAAGGLGWRAREQSRVGRRGRRSPGGSADVP